MEKKTKKITKYKPAILKKKSYTITKRVYSRDAKLFQYL